VNANEEMVVSNGTEREENTFQQCWVLVLPNTDDEYFSISLMSEARVWRMNMQITQYAKKGWR